jgi:Ca2+/Na+ antiporter
MTEILLTGFIFDIVVIAVSFLVLNWASNLAINNAVKLATITRIGKTAIGFSLIAFSTSLPELTVAIIAGLSGGAALSVGNVLGSNIANICRNRVSRNLSLHKVTSKTQRAQIRGNKRYSGFC